MTSDHTPERGGLTAEEREALRNGLHAHQEDGSHSPNDACWYCDTLAEKLAPTVARIVAERTRDAERERDEAVARLGRVEAAMNAAADELDAWDPHPSVVLDGCSPGGVIRYALNAALADDNREDA